MVPRVNVPRNEVQARNPGNFVCAARFSALYTTKPFSPRAFPNDSFIHFISILRFNCLDLRDVELAEPTLDYLSSSITNKCRLSTITLLITKSRIEFKKFLDPAFSKRFMVSFHSQCPLSELLDLGMDWRES